ncbi:2-C-methyl-D-erythritol 2,4-cyclodiphosphate synthase [Candidatus Saganbacteria bacterium]|nr:2-C-methyl-D-erythritol 2,4-cyclodiphosphate synthase [Candidatus Saganbacteria bacterium]
MRIGFGYDAHKLAAGRKLILGGVEIPNEKGLLGHSDADVLLHAIIDALIGAMGEGAIGDFFPDTDPKYKGISSLVLLSKVGEALAKSEMLINNIDTTLVCEEPKIKPYVNQIKENIARILNIEEGKINIKGKTEEKMGFTGRKEGISAYAIALIHKKV